MSSSCSTNEIDLPRQLQPEQGIVACIFRWLAAFSCCMFPFYANKESLISKGARQEQEGDEENNFLDHLTSLAKRG